MRGLKDSGDCAKNSGWPQTKIGNKLKSNLLPVLITPCYVTEIIMRVNSEDSKGKNSP